MKKIIFGLTLTTLVGVLVFGIDAIFSNYKFSRSSIDVAKVEGFQRCQVFAKDHQIEIALQTLRIKEVVNDGLVKEYNVFCPGNNLMGVIADLRYSKYGRSMNIGLCGNGVC